MNYVIEKGTCHILDWWYPIDIILQFALSHFPCFGTFKSLLKANVVQIIFWTTKFKLSIHKDYWIVWTDTPDMDGGLHEFHTYMKC